MANITELLVLIGVFLAAVASSYWLLYRLESTFLVNRRLRKAPGGASAGHTSSVIKDNRVSNRLLAWVQSSTSLNNDVDRRKMSDLLFRAGFESPSAPVWFFIARFGLGIGLPMLFLVGQMLSAAPYGTTKMAIFAVVLCGAGLIAPRAIVDRMAESRREQLQQQFPDALDLMVVCIEAGLGMEAAFVRVGQEVTESHPRIAREFGVLSQELRAGRTRVEALRSLGERTDVPAIRSFSALLIQTDSLGTSVGQTMRTYSQEMRQDRLLKAEEKAMRIPVLMTIPLVACILPVVVTALLLPGMIDMVREGLPALRGTG
ncbi:type II secretion system F family protein [Phenylobacterium sp. LH3H17]|uniref:type II secretion system F family protein n=1 Tax=Phenylobacterium sp. LH3H17 TaxID=2903901 RepID=UPI0020C996AA|nr:type II secretion system F family protein [Phenylobacterium sp. LH3H17]UTP38831.1 type II secretion system F family protein [Phenylobacterium sp. LH3H17]